MKNCKKCGKNHDTLDVRQCICGGTEFEVVSPWYRGDDNGPKKWDLLPDPPRTEAMKALGGIRPLHEEAKRDLRPSSMTAHHDPKIHCAPDDFCPSCKLQRAELSKSRAICSKCITRNKVSDVEIRDGILFCTNTECENSR